MRTIIVLIIERKYEMIKVCNQCGIESDCTNKVVVCPECGGDLAKMKLKEYVMFLYNKGLSLYGISRRTKLSQLLVFNMIDKELSETGDVPHYVQEEYLEKIKDLVSTTFWDGELQSIKEQMPSNCSYATITYVSNLAKKKQAEKAKEERQNRLERVKEAVYKEEPIEDIIEKTNTNTHIVERAVVDMLCEVKESGYDFRDSSYVQAEYINEILRLASDNWDGKLSTLKASLPDDCSYMTIKGTLAVNGLLHNK